MRQSTKSRLKRGLATLLVGGVVLVGLGGMARLTAPSDEVAATEERVLSVAVMPATLVPGYAVPRAFVGRIEARRAAQWQCVGHDLAALASDVARGLDLPPQMLGGQIRAIDMPAWIERRGHAPSSWRRAWNRARAPWGSPPCG